MNLPSFPHVDLFSVGVNALNGALVARHPSHNRGHAVAGLLIMAFFGGIGGGVLRDVLLNELPAPLKDPTCLHTPQLYQCPALVAGAAQKLRQVPAAPEGGIIQPWCARPN